MRDENFGRTKRKICFRCSLLLCFVLCCSFFHGPCTCFSINAFGQSYDTQTQAVKELPGSLQDVYRRIQSGTPNTHPADFPSSPGGTSGKRESSLPLPSLETHEPASNAAEDVVSSGLPPFVFPFPAPDRAVEISLGRATTFAHAGRWAEAIPGLQAFLESDATWFWPDGSTKAMVRTLISSSPATARKMYELLYEPSARLALQRLTKEGNVDLASKAGYAYAQTPSGQSMLFLAARDCYAKSRSLEALAMLRELVRLPFGQTAAMEPELTLMLVSILVRWGKDDEAQTRLTEFFRHTKQLQLSKEISCSSASEVLKFFHAEEEKSFANSAKLPKNTPGNTLPILPGWSERLSLEDAAILHGGRLLDQKMSGRISPAMYPAFQGDDVVIRRGGTLELRNIETGQLKWSSQALEPQVPKSMTQYYSFGTKDQKSAAAETWEASGPWLVFHDRTSGTVALDTRRVYAVENPWRIPDLSNAVFVSDQKRTWPLIRLDQGNTVVARDRRTGKVVWSLGQIPYFEKYLDFVLHQAREKLSTQSLSDDDFSRRAEALRQSLAGTTFFCGKPLLLDERLYLIGRRHGTYSLYTVDAARGTVVAETPLMLTGGSPCSVPTPVTAGMTPIACEGLILCPLPGMLVAVLQGTGEVLWCWHDKKSSLGAMVSGGENFRDLLDSVVNMPAGYGRVWLGAAGRRIVYSSPCAQNTLLCLAPDSGRVAWEKTFSYLLFVVTSPNELVVVAGNSVMQLDPADGQVMATATIPKNRFVAGDGMINAGILYLSLDDGSIAKIVLSAKSLTPKSVAAKSVATLNIETIYSGLPEGGNLVACRDGLLIATPEWLATCPGQGGKPRNLSDRTCPVEEATVLPPIRIDRPLSKSCVWTSSKRFEFEARPRVGKESKPSDLPVFVRPKGRELAVSGQQCPCLKNMRFYLSDDETRLMIFDEFNKLIAQNPIASEQAQGESERNLRKIPDPRLPGHVSECDTDARHRFVLADEGVFLICDRISAENFAIRFALHDRYDRAKDRDVRTIHSERRGLEAEWNAWYRELGLDVCVADSVVAWFDSHGIMTTINLLTGRLRRMTDAGTNSKFVRMFAAGKDVYALVLEFQFQLGANGKRQSVRQWRLERRSPDDGRVLASARLPYTPVFQAGAILLVQSSTDNAFKQIDPVMYLKLRQEASSAESNESNKDHVRKSETDNGVRDVAIANDTVFRLVRNENLALLRLPDGKLVVLDTRNGEVVFQTAKSTKALEGRPIDYELWRDGKDMLILYRFGGLFPEPGDLAGPLPGLANKAVARGQVMRYAADGKELWPEYIEVERTFLFDRQPDSLPCLLLGKADGSEDGNSWRAVTAIDKRSGAYSFRAKIPGSAPGKSGGEVPGQATFFIDQAKRALCIALDAEYRFYFKNEVQTETNHDRR